jgi:predicted metal-dependent hydrolase
MIQVKKATKFVVEHCRIDGHEVELRRKAYQRTLRLRVALDGVLKISCARTVPKAELERFVIDHRQFINARHEEHRRLKKNFPPKAFVEGEEFPFLGQVKILKFEAGQGKPKVFVEKNCLIVRGSIAETEDCRVLIRNFYQRCGRKYLAGRVAFYSQLMQLSPSSLSFRSQSSRWGSCSSRGHVSLNWRLIAAPSDVLDYVVVHELAHLKHHDHSPRFWALVQRFSPQSQELKRWLNEQQWSFEFLARSSPL